MKQALSKTLQLLVMLSIVSFFACKPKTKSSVQQPALNYDLTAAEKFNMPESLLEISGITFNNDDPSSIYAIQDEDGRLFSLSWGIKKARSIKFGPKGDYEDLAILNGRVYVITSSSDFYSFPLNADNDDISSTVQHWENFLPKAEYESLYADVKGQSLYVLTKSAGKKKRNTLGYKIKIDTNSKDLGTISELKFDQDVVEKLGFKLKSGLRVSAITRHPKSLEWYILSSAEKLLVVASPDWQIKGVYDLDSSTFNQPEGITFDKDLNLYISNEGDEITNGNILKFKPLVTK